MERSRFSGGNRVERTLEWCCRACFVRFVSFRSFVYLTRRRVGSILKRPIKSLRNGKERDLCENGTALTVMAPQEARRTYVLRNRSLSLSRARDHADSANNAQTYHRSPTHSRFLKKRYPKTLLTYWSSLINKFTSIAFEAITSVQRFTGISNRSHALEQTKGRARATGLGSLNDRWSFLSALAPISRITDLHHLLQTCQNVFSPQKLRLLLFIETPRINTP